jgi:LmbE family N-acetylglucosaminyl deacetylase
MEALQETRPSTLDEFADLRDGDGVLVVVAHPDDESVGIGGHLREMPRATIVHVTDGAPQDLYDAQAYGFSDWQGYAAARRDELTAAVAEAGIGPEALLALGIPDQQAAHNMARLARKLARLFAEREPRLVFTHPFEGGHPDHDATAFAVWAACGMMAEAGRRPPERLEMAFYHAGLHRPIFQDFAAEPRIPRLEVELDEAALDVKRRMLMRHATQRQTLAPFGASVERFRAAPDYDFRALPNDGRLYYETLPVNFAGVDWLRLIEAAYDELGLRRR